MFAAVRRYSCLDNSPIDTLVGQHAAVREVLVGSPGSRDCAIISTRDGLIVVVVGEDEASVIEAGRRFSAWLDRNLPDLHAVPPDVWAGEVLVHARHEAPGVSARSGSG